MYLIDFYFKLNAVISVIRKYRGVGDLVALIYLITLWLWGFFVRIWRV